MKKYLDKVKLFYSKNQIPVFIGLGMIVLVLSSTGIIISTANSRDEKKVVAPIISMTPTPTAIPTPTLTPAPIYTPPTATPTAGPTSTPTPEPVDPTKGAFRVKILDYDSKQPLQGVSLNTVAFTIDGSSYFRKSGAEVYFHGLEPERTYDVHVEYFFGYKFRGFICGDGCRDGGGDSRECNVDVPAKIPTENRELQCFYSKE